MARLPRPPQSTIRGRILFANDVDGDFEIFVMRADGSRRRQLTHNEVDDLQPAWAPGGRRIVFVREWPKGADAIYILKLVGRAERRWFGTPHAMEGEPEWSPDGRWIAFRGGDYGDGSDVIAMRIDRSERRTVSYQDHNSSNREPTWAPSGRRLALVERHDESEIYVVPFCCEAAPPKRQVTPNDTYWESDVDWSPSGNCILFSRYDRSTSVEDSSSIHVISAEGGSPREVYSDGADAHAGSWSPDGKHIVLSSDINGSYDIFIARSDGSRVQRVTSSDADEVGPAWYARGEPSRRDGCPAPDPESSPGPLPSITPPVP